MVHPRGAGVSNLKEVIIQEFFPAAGKVWEFNFRDSVPTLIMLGKWPSEVLREVQMAKLAVSVMVVGHGMTRSQPFGVPWVIGVTL